MSDTFGDFMISQATKDSEEIRTLRRELTSLRQEHERLKEENVKLKQKVWGLEQAVEIVRARSFEQQIEDLERQVKIAVEALKDEIQREAVHGNQAPHVTARHARLSRVMAEIEAAKGGSGER